MLPAVEHFVSSKAQIVKISHFSPHQTEVSLQKSVFSIKDIYQKVSQNSEEEIIRDLHIRLEKKSFTWVSFVYFAALELGEWYKNSPDVSYQIALRDSDMLLADGIAFRLLHYAFFHQKISGWKILFQYQKFSKLALLNLNGTDFLPKVLTSFQGQKVKVVLYGTTPEILPKSVKFVQEQFGLEAVGAHGYDAFPEALISGIDPVILLVGLGTPRQEKWILEHISMFKKRGNILIFGVG
jgi:UDP-N-acetyl-D-mannosaminuronic acid transferase (WecB/TagA/CpsF family)